MTVYSLWVHNDDWTKDKKVVLELEEEGLELRYDSYEEIPGRYMVYNVYSFRKSNDTLYITIWR